MDSNQQLNEPESTKQQQQQDQKQQQIENARQGILMRFLSQEARERLSRIALVRSDRARSIEDFLINAVRNGAIKGGSGEDGRLSEAELVQILKKLEAGDSEKKITREDSSGKIKFQRRSYNDDDDEENY